MIPLVHILRSLAVLLTCAGAAAAQNAPPPDIGPIRGADINGATVRVGVPDAAQTERIFGVRLLEKAIQPVWIEIANTSSDPVWYLPTPRCKRRAPPSMSAIICGCG